LDLRLAGGCPVIVKAFEKLDIIDIDAHVNKILEVGSASGAIEEVIDPLDLKEVEGVLVFALQALIH
jgi:hypothetical protein